ncbi:MAG: YchJ family metal-binding protein [Lentisphaeraceae bacterium]|nr:YchJ family metal-binding protein [Lentisphaeraceae bacterium]
MSKTLCSCGSAKAYDDCCSLYHSGTNCPTTEALLRARFTAFVKKDKKFLVDTHHPMHITPQLISDLEDTSFEPFGLNINSVESGQQNDIQGSITYSFSYRDNDGIQEFTTTSLYSKRGDQWFYEKDN